MQKETLLSEYYCHPGALTAKQRCQRKSGTPACSDAPATHKHILLVNTNGGKIGWQ